MCGDAAQVGALPEDLAAAGAAVEGAGAGPLQHALRDPRQLQSGAVAQDGGRVGLQPAAGQVMGAAPRGLLRG